MTRIIIAVVAGFIGWSILWLGTDAVLMSIFPDWYGAHQLDFQLAVASGGQFEASTTILVMNIVRSMIISVICGYLAAVLAGENGRSPLFLGILLFVFGLGVEISAWSYVPVWYHVIFLLLLIPMTILGGRFKKVAVN